MGSWGHVSGTQWDVGGARSRALGTPPGSLLSHFLVTPEPTAAERLDTAWGGGGVVRLRALEETEALTRDF